jgi:parvulin-like peptidyl-prolyl isomerase
MVSRDKKKRENNGLYRQALQALIAAIVLATAPFAHAAHTREPVDSIAAAVNGEIILYSEVRERWFQMNSMSEDAAAGTVKMKDALDTLIEEKLIIQFGKDKDLKPTPYELDQAIDGFRKRAEAQGADFEKLLQQEGLTMERYRGMISDQMIARKVLTMEVRSSVHISEEDVTQYYNTHQDIFAGRPKAKISHILKYLPKTATEEDYAKAFKEITAVRDQIMAGLDFAEAAKKYSEDPSKDVGGDLGEVVSGQMVPEFDKAAFALKTGEVSAPVRSPFGWHLIKMTKMMESAPAPLEKVKGEIENRIYSGLVVSHKDEWMKRIKKDALIEIKLN